MVVHTLGAQGDSSFECLKSKDNIFDEFSKEIFAWVMACYINWDRYHYYAGDQTTINSFLKGIYYEIGHTPSIINNIPPVFFCEWEKEREEVFE